MVGVYNTLTSVSSQNTGPILFGNHSWVMNRGVQLNLCRMREKKAVLFLRFFGMEK